MKPTVGHEMIKASAGSGKTYALVTRYLRLLSLGVDPSRITALTFTRKAAGEFLQNILLRLQEAAASEKEAANLSRAMGMVPHPPAFFRDLLRGLVARIGHLQLGTIDHFFGRVVGVFPYELGLSRPHRIMDDFEMQLARQDVMERLLDASVPGREDLVVQLYKELTWGAEEKLVYSLFDKHLERFHGLFLEAGDPGLWGDARRIFAGETWWSETVPEQEKLVSALHRELAEFEENRLQSALAILVDKFANWSPGKDIDGGTIWKQLIEQREDLLKGSVDLSYYRKDYTVSEPLCGLLLRMVRLYMQGEIGRKLKVTGSIGRLLEAFDAEYARTVRETGSLVFADLPMLLIKALQDPIRLIAAADIVYRLDTQTDHWLVDEFQDTSRIQWKVLSAFVDEVLQDPGGQRSFFYVGDVKQSIYSWRGGDSRLFDEIFQHYRRGSTGIRERSLSESWRSAPPVLDCVNSLFGEGLERSTLPSPVRQRWAENWQEHTASPKTAKLPGYAAWGLLREGAGLGEACAELVRTAGPLGRGLSCGILVRDNKLVRSLTDDLRAAGIPASMEGSVPVALDNVVGCWIRAFLFALARPSTGFPSGYLRAVGKGLDEHGFTGLAARVRGDLSREGFAAGIRRLLDHLQPLIGDNPFLRRRSAQILEAATRFDRTGNPFLESFLTFLERASVEESSLSSQVQVMTVHKAKGLAFDMVIVAGFGPDPVLKPGRSSLHVERDADGEVQWVLDMPRKSVVESDPRLLDAQTSSDEVNLFEALCVLYVAMTRSRQGLYCIAEAPTGNSNQLTWHALYASAFGKDPAVGSLETVEFQRAWGDPLWFEKATRRPAKPVPVGLKALSTPLPEVNRPLRQLASPSRAAHEAEQGIRPLRSNKGRRFGTWMHDFLATLEWISFDDPEERQQLLQQADSRIRDRLAAFLDTAAAREVFEKPPQRCRLWREKPYVLRRGDAMSQGIIDRAVLFLRDDGQPERLCIYDFKTDVLDPDRPAEEQLRERYGLQLERYTEAACLLTGLPATRIETRLVPV